MVRRFRPKYPASEYDFISFVGVIFPFLKRINLRLDLIKQWLQNRSVLNFSALSDPTRQRIVEMLAIRDLSSGEIADRFEISAPAVSQHLSVLKEAGIVRVSVEAQRRIYHLELAGFIELELWLQNIKKFWSGRLNVLENQLRKSSVKSRRRKNGHKTRRSL